MVDERVQLQPAAAVVRLAIREQRAAIDVEGTDAGVDDPFGAGKSAREHELLPTVREVVVDPTIELRLARALVGEVRVLGARAVGNQPARPRQRVLRVEAGAHLVRPSVVDRGGMSCAHREEGAVATVDPARVAVERAGLHGEGGSLHLPAAKL
jgi:hypothetical protein